MTDSQLCMVNDLAHGEYHRTKDMQAFTFKHNPIKRKLNQFCISYKFKDNSELRVMKTSNTMRYYDCNGVVWAERMLFV